MPARRAKGSDDRTLPPFPEGWFFVASRDSLLKAKLIEKTWMGQNIVAWCDDAGRVCVAVAACPHLGANLAPSAGGQVRDGRLVCPFHGFQFDASGQCVATPFAPAPKATSLKVFETREVLGMVFAWWGIDERPPQWSLPDDPPTGPDWSGLGFRTLRFAGHPQETSENSVDMAHLLYVHGYGNVHQAGPVTVDGACLKSCFDFRRTRTFAGVKDLIFDVSAAASVFGLGYSFVEIREHTIGMDARLWVLATPVDGTLIEMVLVGQIREIRRPKRAVVGLRFLPVSLRARVMNQIILSVQKRDVLQDVVIWGNKRYRSAPRLCRSDGEIGVYRRYCRQFYPDRQDSGHDGPFDPDQSTDPGT